MGTGTTGRDPKAVKLPRCSICRKVPQPDCAWRQGRCPHRPLGAVEYMIKKIFRF